MKFTAFKNKLFAGGLLAINVLSNTGVLPGRTGLAISMATAGLGAAIQVFAQYRNPDGSKAKAREEPSAARPRTRKRRTTSAPTNDQE